ncbi:MAG: PKD domain-containing protein [Thermoplasmata archaeon]
MRRTTLLIASAALALLLVASLAPLMAPRSDNPCSECHGGGYWQYLDIVEGAAGESIPSSLDASGPRNVTVVIKNECSKSDYSTLEGVSATLRSRDGRFRVAVPTVELGSLARGATAKASWEITAAKSGTDAFIITAQAVNPHFECRFTDSYSPPPEIVVEAPAQNSPPSIALGAELEGRRLSGGSAWTVTWNCSDEELEGCTVQIFFSTDGFVHSNESIGSAPALQRSLVWTLPRIDAEAARLRAFIKDREGLGFWSPPGGPFAIDSTPPSVLDVLPPDGAVNVSAGSPLIVRFSEPVHRASAELALRALPSPGGMSFSWSPDSTTMSVAHEPLHPETLYECELGTEVKDLSEPGNYMVGTFAWSFTTGATGGVRPEIALLSPSGWERYYWSDTINVSWSAWGGEGNLSTSLSISGNGTEGPFQELVSGLPASGTLELPAPELVSDTCVLCATVMDGTGRSASSLSSPFSIAPPLSLAASFPPEGSVLEEGDVVELSWSASGGHGKVTVRIDFRPSPGAGEEPVAAGLEPNGSYLWTVPGVHAGAVVLIIRASDDWNGTVEQVSPPFRIHLEEPPPTPANLPPVAAFFIEGNRVVAGREATFNAGPSRDPEGDPLSFLWSFGDGSATLLTTDPIVRHTYARTGAYIVTLTVSDGAREARVAVTILVEASAASTAAQEVGAPPALVGLAILFAGSLGIVYALTGGRERPVRAGEKERKKRRGKPEERMERRVEEEKGEKREVG